MRLQPDLIWQLLRGLGLLVMATLIATAFRPTYRGSRRLILGSALAVYVIGGMILIIWRLMTTP